MCLGNKSKNLSYVLVLEIHIISRIDLILTQISVILSHKPLATLKL